MTGRPASRPGCTLDVVAFPARDLAEELVLHLTLSGPEDWRSLTTTLGVDLELTFREPGTEPVLWTPPRVLLATAAGPSQSFPLPALSIS